MVRLTHHKRVFPWLIVGLAVALVATLGGQNKLLKYRYQRLLERTAGPRIGLSMPAFETVTADGDAVMIGETTGGDNQVLFFFTTTCSFCRRTLPAWNEIATQANARSGFQVYGIQLDTADVASSLGAVSEIRFPVVGLPDSRIREWYRVDGVPATVVLGDDGLVLYAKVGEILKRQVIDTVLAAAVDSSSSTSPIAGALTQNGQSR